jgi:hypothetical protein
MYTNIPKIETTGIITSILQIYENRQKGNNTHTKNSNGTKLFSV